MLALAPETVEKSRIRLAPDPGAPVFPRMMQFDNEKYRKWTDRHLEGLNINLVWPRLYKEYSYGEGLNG
uniref:Uncharacterized protein n=1 Tax=Aquisalinus luteolus TaxID=1566827 RepID=A0A8J3A533_9PROT|nr:hypothetical protein GCM10011355_03060 [Aquisalinus luteolus]